jgi:L-alanine-DL-glutamate epimerase-like enolase superfamily enzyme
MTRYPKIKSVHVHSNASEDHGADYHDQPSGHWIVDSKIATPMSMYADYRGSRTGWGINVLGGIVVQIEAEDGTTGVAAGFGGAVSQILIERHFRRFIEGSDPTEINRMWDQMYKSSMFYGRKGVAVAAISAVDLALWDLLGKLREEPVYAMIGGKVRDEIPCYQTSSRPDLAKELGFFGGKIPLPYGPGEGREGFHKNVAYLAEMRKAVGKDYPLMVDCWMALDRQYAIELAHACREIGIHWFEEVLQPDDVEGYRELKRACPWQKWTTGEHEYTRYGFRALLETAAIDIIQPDVMWCGGLTELLRISAIAAAYDVPVVPHGSGEYSYHFVLTQPHIHFCEYINLSPASDRVVPCFGSLFVEETLPVNGVVSCSDAPGFGLELAQRTNMRETA